MGRRGPKPLPSALRDQEALRPARRNALEPVPFLLPAVSDPPERLSPEARVIWRRLGPELRQAGVLTSFDTETFALLCDVLDKAQQAGEILSRSGPLVKGRDGGLVTNPAWRVYRDAVGMARQLAQEFGLTPSARSTIRVRVDLLEEVTRTPG